MQVTLDPTKIPAIPGARVALLQSKWYGDHLGKMGDKCVALLDGTGCLPIERHVIAGSWELPLATQTIIRHGAKNGKIYDAVICLGAIMKGDTYHFDMIMNECSRGLGQVMLTESVPIVMEVIPVSSEEQLIARSQDNAFNKGIETALATAEVIAWRRKLEGR